MFIDKRGRDIDPNNIVFPSNSEPIGRFKKGKILISTSYVDDTHKFETGVVHPEFDPHRCIIVQEYENKRRAILGHKKWCQIMTTNPLPKHLIDVSTSFCAIMQDKTEGRAWRVFKRGRIK